MYSCYKITDVALKTVLINSFPSFMENECNVYCDHITHEFPSKEPPPPLTSLEITGTIYEHDKVAAVLVRVNGSDIRPDGKMYHITILTGRDVKPVYTNTAIENCSINMHQRPIKLDVTKFVGVIQS